MLSSAPVTLSTSIVPWALPVPYEPGAVVSSGRPQGTTGLKLASLQESSTTHGRHGPPQSMPVSPLSCTWFEQDPSHTAVQAFAVGSHASYDVQ
jgi:hypothetical protein